MTQRWLALSLVVVTAVGVMLAGYLGWQRHRVEQENRQVEVAVEFAEVVRLAERSSIEPIEVLRRLRQAGATSVLFKEQVLADLDWRQVWLKGGEELLADPGMAGLAGEINPVYTYVLTRHQDIQQRVATALEIKSRVGMAQRLSAGQSLFLVGTPLDTWEIASIGFGFAEDELDMVTREGMRLILQVRSWTPVRGNAIYQVFQPLMRYRQQMAVLLFNDYQLPGYPAGKAILAEEAGRLGVPVGIIEFFPQKGINELALALGKNAVRLHSISAKEMGAMTPRKAVDRFILASTDRNMRVLFVRLFFKSDEPDWMTANENYMTSLRDALKSEGFQFGPPVPFGSLPASRMYLMVMGLAVIAGGMLLLRAVGLGRMGLLLGLGAAVVCAGALAVGYALLMTKLLALAATVIFPALGIIIWQRERGTTVAGAAVRLLLTSLVSLAGAALVVGLLADRSFMLKINEFSGIKVTFMGPLLLLTIVFCLWPQRGRWREWVRKCLDTPITGRYILVGLVAAVLVGVYLTRTGNMGTPLAGGLELKARHFLDVVLAVRPRTKEFLIGHPLLMLSFYLGYRHQWLPVLILGAIGQASLVNTFTHIHTPLAVSLLRTVNGLWLGMVLGLLLILVYRWLESRMPQRTPGGPGGRSGVRYR